MSSLKNGKFRPNFQAGDPNNARARVAIAKYLLGVGPVPPPVSHKLGYMENANLRLQATPLENPGPVQGATPPSGDMEVPNVPKLPRNLTININ
ncbi:hypothetical protein BGY98DRAFT_1092891 [Russula aff. rugulosa BPL654]|nr:hypothetical protein BGY98DRAFT_1092891 [Russula aff. rugulosa BPL654]